MMTTGERQTDRRAAIGPGRGREPVARRSMARRSRRDGCGVDWVLTWRLLVVEGRERQALDDEAQYARDQDRIAAVLRSGPDRPIRV
jgi:hypothetical protein